MATDKSAATVKPSKDAKPSQRVRPQSAGQSGGDGFGHKTTKYLGEVRTELRKTTWPDKAELIAQTQVVIGLLIVVGVFIAGWDFILGQIFQGILRLLGVAHTG
jgi:preprotein translocase subunit SecE